MNLKELRNNHWFAVVIAVLISIFFTVISISSAYKMDQNLSTLSEHPFTVSANLYKIRGYLSDSQIYINRLTMNNHSGDVEFVTQKLTYIEPKIWKCYSYVQDYYLGSKEDVAALESYLHQVISTEYDFLEIADDSHLPENIEHIQQNLNPQYTAIEDITSEMLAFTEKSVVNLSHSSNEVLKRTIFYSITLSACLILFAVLYQRSVMEQTKDTKFKEFLFNVLSDNIDDVFIIYNVDLQSIEFVSSNTQRMLGIITDKIIANGMQTIFDCCDKQSCADIIQAFENKTLKKRIEAECVMHNPDTANQHTVSISVYPIVEKERVNRYIVSIVDLSETKRMQQVLKDALLNAQKANYTKNAFFSNMSHEMRTPMNAIIGMTTIAATVINQPDRLENCLTKIASSSKLLLMLVNDILDMSKIESGKLSLINEPFSLSEIIEDVCDIIYVQTDMKKQNFNVSVDVCHESLIGDSLRLKQILLNMLSNAVKYTPQNKDIKLTIQEFPNPNSNTIRIRFSVIDNGIGMSEEFMQKLFQPFEQEKQNSGGTGLGLAITKNLVTLANGTINVKSELGKGSTFVAELPFEVIESNAETDKKVVPLSDLKVLVVDDDKDTCCHTSIILERIGVIAQWALSGEKAIEMTIQAYESNNNFDVIFMDWQMPEMDGLEATRKIRSIVGANTLIIIISAFDWSEIEQQAREAGANAFISKPMFQSTIYNTLVHITKNAPLPQPSRMKNLFDFSGKRFLVAEDNEINAEIAIELLHLVNAHVDVATNGKIAVEMFQKSAPGYYDAILMDVQMPIMDGYQATITIRKQSREDSKYIPIIAMTANAFTEDIAVALQSGMNAHIAKPIDFEKLCSIIQTTLEKTEHDRMG